MHAVAQPQIPKHLESLDDLSLAITYDESLAEFAASNQSISGANARALSISEAKLEKIDASEANFERLSLGDVIFLQSDLTATNCAESAWRRVQFTNMRCSGIKLPTSTLSHVVFKDCKLNLSNFRYAKLKNIHFKDCVLDEADFYSAELENVRFQGCALSRAEFSGAKCKNVDLRTSEISEVRGITGLAGTIINSVQLVAVSQILASEFKISVLDD